ncbi:hypothetical protein OQA88_6284 [Cercophora sp. LCS_1]
MSAPKVLSRKINGIAGPSVNETPKAPRVKPPPEGEKVVVRRLPPSMTEDEFVAILGDEWRVGNGKVGWVSYFPGKVSQQSVAFHIPAVGVAKLLTRIAYSPSKPSTPSRAYLYVTKRENLHAFSETVRTANWQDAKGTFNDQALLYPPSVEFAIYKKVPSHKKRTDNRQGTIDQDEDFMAFLEGLANPDAHKEVEQASEETPKGERPTTTPLIEHLREKAAKAKEAAAAKNAKHSRQESQSGKGKATATSPEEPKKKSKDSKAERLSEKAAGKAPEKIRESVKILSKKAAVDTTAAAAKSIAAHIQAPAQTSAQANTPEQPPKSRRAGIAAAARILQRDLGLSPGNAHRKARQDAAKAEAEAKAGTPKEPTKESTPTIQRPSPPPTPIEPSPSAASPPPSAAPSGPSAQSKQQATPSSRRTRARNRAGAAVEESVKTKPDGKHDSKSAVKSERATDSGSSQPPAKPPIVVLKKKDAPPSAPSPSSTPAPAASSSAPTPPSGPKAAASRQQAASKKGSAATPSPGATRAFIKHANHSQGVTEALLMEAMQAFGGVNSVEMDRKKGFAYVDFADHDGLAKAMAANPVTVAQATVQVLERKEVGEKKGRGGKGGALTPASSNVASTEPGNAASSSTSQAPTAPAAMSGEKAEKEKRRRRGGRGRGDKDGGKDGGSKDSDKGADAGAPSGQSA